MRRRHYTIMVGQDIPVTTGQWGRFLPALEAACHNVLGADPLTGRIGLGFTWFTRKLRPGKGPFLHYTWVNVSHELEHLKVLGEEPRVMLESQLVDGVDVGGRARLELHLEVRP